MRVNASIRRNGKPFRSRPTIHQRVALLQLAEQIEFDGSSAISPGRQATSVALHWKPGSAFIIGADARRRPRLRDIAAPAAEQAARARRLRKAIRALMSADAFEVGSSTDFREPDSRVARFRRYLACESPTRDGQREGVVGRCNVFRLACFIGVGCGNKGISRAKEMSGARQSYQCFHLSLRASPVGAGNS